MVIAYIVAILAVIGVGVLVGRAIYRDIKAEKNDTKRQKLISFYLGVLLLGSITVVLSYTVFLPQRDALSNWLFGAVK